MRDKYCDEKYLRKIIKYSYERINECEKWLRDIEEDEKNSIEKYPADNYIIMRNFSYEHFRLEKGVINILYSWGEDIDKLPAYFYKGVSHFDYFEHWFGAEPPYCTYYELISFISLGVLFEADDESMKKLAHVIYTNGIRDGMIDFLLLSYDIGWQRNSGKYCMPNPYRYTKEIILKAQDNKEEATALLEEFVKKKWLSGHRWGSEHKKEGYAGLWCFEAAAIAKILGLDDSGLKKNKNYPYELAHYKSEKAFTTANLSKWLEMQEEGYGQKCIEHEKEYLAQIEADYTKLDDASFYDKYKEEFLEELFLNSREYSEYRKDKNDGILGFLLVNRLVIDGYILQMDFKDPPEDELPDFVNERLLTDYDINVISFEEEESEHGDVNIETYDEKYVKKMNTKLKRKGFRLVWFLLDNDQYYVCVLPKTILLGKKWHEIELKT